MTLADPGAAAATGRGILLDDGTLSARLIPYGAALADLWLAGFSQPLVLGFPDPADYRAHSPYFGATVGRWANRIAHGRCMLDGRELELERGEDGHHLHGGGASFARRDWDVVSASDRHAEFAIAGPDGEGGFPGRIEARVRYDIAAPGTLRIEMTATSDRRTYAGFTHHSYFNLSGRADIHDHVLEIAAEDYLPCDAELIPTGEVAPVAGTAFDFRAPRRVGPAAGEPALYNNTFCLHRDRIDTPRLAARLRAPGGPTLELRTTAPGLHLYNGYKLGVAVPGHGGRAYGPFAGLCLEPQLWPDAPNRPHFPSALLAPGEVYRQVTELRLAP